VNNTIKKELISPALLRKILRYDAETGDLFWRERPDEMFTSKGSAKGWNVQFSGKKALMTLDGEGYRRGRILGRKYRMHRVCWAIETGSWPIAELDHINGIRDDNRISNLREVAHAENMRNKRLQANNSSGVAGVCRNKTNGKWQSQIKVSGRLHALGLFSKFEEAVLARREAEEKYGFHKNHGTCAAESDLPKESHP